MVKIPVVFLWAVAAAQTALAQAPAEQSPAAQAAGDARAACAGDIQKFCSGVPAGGGRIVACLKQHASDVSLGCTHAIVTATQLSQASADPRALPAEARPAAPSASTTPPPTAQAQKQSATATKSEAGARYYRLKQVQIVDQIQGKPAYSLLVPTTWQFKGTVSQGTAEGGCFADWFSVLGLAKSADNSLEFQLLPQFTWQYADDPTTLQQMQRQGQLDARVGMKPCPVRAPVSAAEFLRQDLIAKYRKGKTVVSVEPFPELEQMTRHRLGLGPPTAGGGPGAVRTDAARARIAYNDERGSRSRSGSPRSSSCGPCPRVAAVRRTTGMPSA